MSTLHLLRVDDYTLQPGARCMVTQTRGFGLPAPRRAVYERAERHGSIDETAQHTGRLFELAGIVWGDEAASEWDELDEFKARLALGAERTITFRRRGRDFDERARVRVATVLDDDAAQGFIRWAVSLYAADPRLYGAALRSGAYDPAAALSGGGVTFPLAFPLDFSTTTASHLQLTNDGQFPTPPVLRIRGPVNDPSVDNDTVGASLRIAYPLGSSDVVVVDVAARSVTLNGAPRADLFDAQGSRWWEMVRGTNRIRLRGTGMSLGATQLTVEYRDARI